MADYSELSNQVTPEKTVRDHPYAGELDDQQNLSFDASSTIPEGKHGETPTDRDLQNISDQFHSALSMNSYPATPPRSVMPDPVMRQAYAMPPAGLPARQNHENYYASPSAGRQYKMASDIFGTGMDRSWNSGSGSPAASPNSRGAQRNEPASFKITETTSRTSTSSISNEQEPASNNSSNHRIKTRESAGNPLTGQGYDSTNTKTAKRYFEGSNSNQKLW